MGIVVASEIRLWNRKRSYVQISKCMQTVQFYLKLKPQVSNSGLGNTEDKVICTCPSGQFPFCCLSLFWGHKEIPGVLWKTVSEAYTSSTLSAEQGHAKCYLLESKGDRKDKWCQGKWVYCPVDCLRKYGLRLVHVFFLFPFLAVLQACGILVPQSRTALSLNHWTSRKSFFSS